MEVVEWKVFLEHERIIISSAMTKPPLKLLGITQLTCSPARPGEVKPQLVELWVMLYPSHALLTAQVKFLLNPYAADG